MRRHYLLWNPGPKAVRIGDESLPPEQFGRKSLDCDEVDHLLPELRDKGVHLYRLMAMDIEGRRPVRRRDDSEEEGPTPTQASPRQRELYRKLSGHDLPENATRITASDLIDWLMRAKMKADELEEEAKPPIVAPISEKCLEVLAERLYVAHMPFFPKEMKGTTIVVNFSGTPIQALDNTFVMSCPPDDNIDEQVLAGVVRFCAAGIRGTKQRVLIYGSPDAGYVVAACVLREHLGIPAEKAIQILRRVEPSALNKPELVATVGGYRVT